MLDLLRKLRMKNSTAAAELTVEKDNQTSKLIFYVIVTVITLLGFLGNSLVLVTMTHRKSRHSSTCVYLTVLSLVDSVVLFVSVFTMDVLASDIWLEFDLRDVSLPLCWLCEYLYFWGPQLSSWCIVAITLERVIAITRPHR